MLLPLGDHPLDSARVPWVTVAVLLLCLVVSLVSSGLQPEPAPDRDGMLAEAVTFWSERAYLDSAPEIQIEASRGLDYDERVARLESLREASYARWPSSEPIRLAEQQQLDDLTERALGGAATRAGPPLGLIPAAPELRGLLTYAFVHRGGLVLLASLIALFLLGAALEGSWREPLLAAFVAGAILWAGGFYWLMVPGSTVPLLGSSALVSSLLAACLVRYRESGCRVAYFLWSGGLKSGTFLLPAWTLAVPWLIVETVRVALHGSIATLAHQADVGGLIFGASVALALGHASPQRVENAATDGEEPRASVLERVRSARARRDDEEAFVLLQDEIRRRGGDNEVIIEFWDVAVECGRAGAACRPMLGLIQGCVSRGELSTAAQLWANVTSVMPNVRLDPDSLVRLASALLKLSGRETALDALGKAIDPRNEGLRAETAVRAVSLAREIEDTDVILAAAQRAAECPDLDPAQKARYRDLIQEIALPQDPARSEPTPAPPDSTSPDRTLPDRTSGEPSSVPDGAGVEQTPASLPDAPPALRGAGAVPPRTPDDQTAPSSELVPRFSGVKVLEGVPELIGERALTVRVSENRVIDVEYAQVQALTAVGVLGLADAPVVIIDLVLNWNHEGGVPVQVIRMRGDRFDPRHLVGDGVRLVEAYRVFLNELQTHTNAVPLPDPQSASGQPMRIYDTLGAYHRKVLDAQSDEAPTSSS